MNDVTPQRALPPRLIAVLRLLITVGLPVFLVLSGVRLVMSETFLQIEYNRPGFPADRYGFTREDRLRYAPYAIEYLRSDAGISYLGDLELDGEPMYTPKELRHMEDVKAVTRLALAVHTALSILLLLSVIALAWQPATRHALRQGLFEGGLFTLLLIVTLVIVVVASWDFFFTGFHRLFFEGDSWQFSTRSTLIRLFPERFWFDAALAIGLFTVVGVLAAIGIAWGWERQARRRETPPAEPTAS
ncbi:MAG: TIGR01906 family membrane protein [Chloroflexi bacterium]|nr:TIGR01906 family membrane protein [Chloroflexota bacterium]